MYKRGQITAFIIVGILLLGVAASTYYLFSSPAVESSVNPIPSIASPKEFIDACLRQSSEEGLRDVLAQGGYYKPTTFPVISFVNGDTVFDVPYYFQNGEEHVPSLSVVESELENAVRDKFAVCVNDFALYREHGFTLQSSEPIIDATFTDAVTTVSLTFPILFTIEGNSQEYDHFSVVLPFDFKSKYADIEQYIALQRTQQDQFLVSSLSDVAALQDADFTFLQSGNAGEEVLVNFGYGDGDEVLNYRFGLHYDWVLGSAPGTVELVESPLSISRLVPWNITKAGVWRYYPQVRGEGVAYSIDTDVVSINPVTGEITADTSKLTNDEYLFIIQVRDAHNRTASAPFQINVNVNNGTLLSIESAGVITTTKRRDFSYPILFENPGDEIEFILDGPDPFTIDPKTGVLTADTRDIEGNYSMRVDVRNEHGSTWMRFGVEVK